MITQPRPASAFGSFPVPIITITLTCAITIAGIHHCIHPDPNGSLNYAMHFLTSVLSIQQNRRLATSIPDSTVLLDDDWPRRAKSDLLWLSRYGRFPRFTIPFSRIHIYRFILDRMQARDVC